MTRQTRRLWEKRVRRWTKSGLDAEAFAAQEGVEAKTLVWWRWRLGLGPGGRARAPVLASSAAGRAEADVPTFLEVALARAPTAVREVPARGARVEAPEALEVHVGRCRVVVRPGFDAVTLQRLLRALEAH